MGKANIAVKPCEIRNRDSIGEIKVTETIREVTREIVYRREIKREVDELEKQRLGLKSVNDKLAEKEITKYLTEQKNKGMTKISIIEIVDVLGLPAEQIELVMHKLKSRGVKEVE